MSPTIEDLRTTLDDVAHGYEAPDPHTVLAGAYARSGELGRRRTTHRWAAAAAAVVAIGGASLLLTDLGGDTQGEVAPAVPDESYTEGYGIIDGVPQPYADGLTLVSTLEDISPGGGAEILGFQTDADTQMYAQAWCATGTSEVEIEVGTFETGLERLTAPCADPAVDSEHLASPVALPPDVEGFHVMGGGSATGVALVAIYEEAAWRDYPFPSWDRVPFPSAEGVVIDSGTPLTTDPALESMMPPRRVHSVTVPLTDEPLSFDVQLNGPGQLLVAIDGVVLTNDREELDRLEQTVPGRWDIADPSLREGYLHSFGQEQRKTGGGFTPQVLAEDGVDVSDGEITVSVHAQGFPNDDWRVVISSDSAGEGLGAAEPLPPVAESDFAEYAFGHRLVEAYEVPTDGVVHPISLDAASAAELTWVPQCPEKGLNGAGALGPDIGTVTVAGSSGSLRCLVGDGWLAALPPSDFESGLPGDERSTVALRPVEGLDHQAVAVYEPVPFEDFPFEQGQPLFDDVVPQDGEVFGGGLVFGVTDTVTSADLDTDGSATIEIPESRLTQLYVTTEGKGRFWLESAEPAEGAITGTGSPSSPENNFSGTLGRDEWWTSWTDQRATWPITARTDSGRDPERVVLRVEGYEEGSFELQVIGQFPEDEQP